MGRKILATEVNYVTHLAFLDEVCQDGIVLTQIWKKEIPTEFFEPKKISFDL